MMVEEGRPEADAPLGPTPLLSIGTLKKLIFGDDDKAKWKIAGWLDADYTFRSTGPGINNIAGVIKRFGDEALMREIRRRFLRSMSPRSGCGWSK